MVVEKVLAKGKKLYAAFMDLVKAYDRVDWLALWDVLKIYGVGGAGVGTGDEGLEGASVGTGDEGCEGAGVGTGDEGCEGAGVRTRDGGCEGAGVGTGVEGCEGVVVGVGVGGAGVLSLSTMQGLR